MREPSFATATLGLAIATSTLVRHESCVAIAITGLLSRKVSLANAVFMISHRESKLPGALAMMEAAIPS